MQLAKLIVATTGKLINVRWKVKFLVKDDPKVTDIITEDNTFVLPLGVRQWSHELRSY